MDISKAKLQRIPAAGDWADRAMLVATLLICAVALSSNIPDPDLWGHVQYGRDLLREGLPRTTTYSFTATGYPWINHENLAEILLAWGMDTIGPVGMLIAKCLLGIGVLGLVIQHARHARVAMLSVCVVALLFAVNLRYFWCMRPQLLSLSLYALLLALLSWCFATWDGRWWSLGAAWPARQLHDPPPGDCSRRRLRFLWLLPLIFCVWANSHGGFVAGLCVLGVYLAGRSLEAWTRWGAVSRGLIGRFAVFWLAALLATFVNPYGVGLHLWLLETVPPPRPEILEWRAPDLLALVMLPLWLILVTWLAALTLSRRSLDPTHLAVLLATFWQALCHQRHIPFFAIGFGFWAVIHVDSVLRRFHIIRDGQDAEKMPAARRKVLAVALGLAIAVLGFRLYGNLREMPVERREYPVAAFQYVADRNLNGNLVVTFNWAQYALAALGTPGPQGDGLRVGFDGRFDTCYPREIIDLNFDFMLGELEQRSRGANSPEFDDDRVLELGRPDLVLINRYQPHSVNVMFRNRDRWTLLYQDRMAQLWGRASRYDDPHSPDFLPRALRRISDQEQQGSVPWPALPLRGPSLHQLAASGRTELSPGFPLSP